jgi:hypothetical protein
MTITLRVTLISVILCASACNRSANNPPAASTAAAKPAHTLTSDELVAAYKANALGADQKYKNQYVEISGEIGRIGKGLMGHPFVSLGTAAEDDLFGVTCYLTPNAANAAAAMKPGEKVKLRGTCMGQLAGQAIRLQDCEFVK